MKECYQLKKASGRGEGVFAVRAIDAGETVMVGEIEKELEENHSHASQIGEDRYVFHAGLISKVNHSCDPNCGIKVNESGAHDFVAMRDISNDEEITFDYAMRNYGIDYFPKECGCGSEICRGTITGWKDLSQKTKNNYEGFVAGYLLDLDKLVYSK
ncbi:MAG: SET domain-containing protein [Spirochaetes bacterium]|nr:SET domain-containing protein [Spirochaetota bacterium]